MKNIIIAGASGMVGSILLDHCLSSSEVGQVISLVRTNSGKQHSKLREVVINDFADYTNHTELFENTDVGFFCIGVYTGQVPNDKFKIITVDYAVKFAEAIKNQNPNATVCLLSGAGADRTEKSNTAFAKYKGMAENQISTLNLNFFAFRPGYIYPVTPRKEPNIMYKISRWMYPLIRLGGSNASIKSTELAAAMFNVGMKGAEKEILENRDILGYV